MAIAIVYIILGAALFVSYAPDIARKPKEAKGYFFATCGIVEVVYGILLIVNGCCV